MLRDTPLAGVRVLAAGASSALRALPARVKKGVAVAKDKEQRDD